jgi:ribosome biogenesis GTPase / thiamine phosphate phosphatase
MSLSAFGWNENWQQEFDRLALDGTVPGRVVSEHRSHMRVAVHGEVISAEVSGRLWNEAELRTDMPGVGDFVAVSPSDGDGPAIIEAMLPRKGALIRQAAGERRPQLVAANVDVALIVTALDGDYSALRIERYLGLVRDGNALPVIVINKADIAIGLEAARAELEEIAPGVAVHVVSAHDGSCLAELEQYFDGGRTVALLGSSGVGKSTLTNQMLGREVQVTQEVSAHDNRGRHTTTHRELFVRPDGGVIMDMPGMGGLVLWEAEAEPEDDFADIEELATQCKFRNCAHDREPACAVQAAIARGELDIDRVKKFQAQNA